MWLYYIGIAVLFAIQFLAIYIYIKHDNKTITLTTTTTQVSFGEYNIEEDRVVNEGHPNDPKMRRVAMVTFFTASSFLLMSIGLMGST